MNAGASNGVGELGGFFGKNLILGVAEVLCRVPLVFAIGFLARGVGPEVYGSWVLILVFQTLVTNVTGLGLSSSLSRLASVCDAPVARGYLWVAFNAVGTTLAGTAVLVWALYPWLGRGLGVMEPYRWLLLPALLISVAAACEGLLDAYFKARERLVRQVTFLLGRSLAELVAVLAVFRWGVGIDPSDPRGLLVAYVALGFLGRLVVYAPLVWFDRTATVRPESSARAEFRRYGLPLIPAALVTWLAGQGDRLVLGHLADKASLGLYGFAAVLAGYVVYIGYAVYPLLLPRASRLYDAGDREGLRTLFVRSQFLVLLLAAAVLGGAVLFGPEVISWTAGAEFVPAVRAFAVLSAAVALEQLLGVYQYVFHLVKRPRWVLWVNVAYAILNLGGVALAARIAGVAAVPWAVLAAVFTANVIRYRAAQQHLHLPIPGRLLAAVGILAVVLTSLAWIAEDTGVTVRLALFVVLVVAVGSAVAGSPDVVARSGSRRSSSSC